MTTARWMAVAVLALAGCGGNGTTIIGSGSTGDATVGSVSSSSSGSSGGDGGGGTMAGVGGAGGAAASTGAGGGAPALCDGQCDPELLTTTPGNPKAITIDAQRVFWAGNGGVWMCSKLDCSGLEQIATDNSSSVFVEGGYVFWTDDVGGAVHVRAVGGGPVQDIVTGQGFPSGVVSAGGWTFWSNEGGAPGAGSVNRAPNPKPVVSGLTSPRVLGAFAGLVFWSDASALHTLTYGGTAGPSFGSAVALGVTSDGADVYWTEGDAVHRKAVDGSGSAVSIASGLKTPRAITVQGDRLYWTSGDGVTGSTLDGATTFSMADATGAPFAVAVDADSLFWVGTQDGKLWRVER